MPAPAPDRRSITLVQGLRAAAALAVTLHHVLNDGSAMGGAAPDPRWRGLSWDAGIDVFFVISGFVMVYSSEALFAAPGAAGAFAVRRVVRVAPLYWAATTAFLASTLLPGGVHAPLGGPAYVAASYLFLPWPRADGVMHPLYEVGWTLNCEMLFYAVFSAFVFLPRRRAVACVALALAAGVAWAPRQSQLAFWTDPIVLEFVFGMATALVLREGVRASPGARAVLTALAAALVLALGLAAPDLGRWLRFGAPAALVVAAATLGGEPRLPAPVRGATLALGDASYALYLVHPFVMRALQIVWLKLHAGGALGVWSYVVAAVAVSVAASLAVHAWVEAPVTRALRVTRRPARL